MTAVITEAMVTAMIDACPDLPAVAATRLLIALSIGQAGRDMAAYISAVEPDGAEAERAARRAACGTADDGSPSLVGARLLIMARQAAANRVQHLDGQIAALGRALADQDGRRPRYTLHELADRTGVLLGAAGALHEAAR